MWVKIMKRRTIQFGALKSLLGKFTSCVSYQGLFLCWWLRGRISCPPVYFLCAGVSISASLPTPLLIVATVKLVATGYKRLFRDNNPAPALYFTFQQNSNVSQKRVVGLPKHSHTEPHCRMGVRQRLRKGFRKQWCGRQDSRGWKSSDSIVSKPETAFSEEICGATIAVPTACPESLSSAAV